MSKKYNIILPCDQAEAEEFAAWLENRGHAVTIGNSTGTYADGSASYSDITTNTVMRRLWTAYCNS